ncbi:MAG: hypothetical protein ACLQBQ_13570 [Smithella sp.]
MKKITAATIAIMFIFITAGFSFAAKEFQINGIVTKINGNKITIKGHKGKKTTIDVRLIGIKVGDSLLLADKFQIKGIVTKINGNKITIKGNKGKETTIDVRLIGIKVGDSLLLSRVL